MKEATAKKFVIILSILTIAIFAFVGWFLLALFNGKPPHFFPLNNKEARYTIIKSSKMGQGWVEQEATPSSDLSEPRYYVEYRGEGVFQNGGNNFFRITVGKSDIELEPYIGKDVIVTKGDFVTSSEQCIAGKCTNIDGPYAVLNVDELELVR